MPRQGCRKKFTKRICAASTLPGTRKEGHIEIKWVSHGIQTTPPCDKILAKIPWNVKETFNLNNRLESLKAVFFLRSPHIETIHLWCTMYAYVLYVEIHDQHCKASFVLRTIRRQQDMLNNAEQSGGCAHANLAAQTTWNKQEDRDRPVGARKSHSWGTWSAKFLDFSPSANSAPQIDEFLLERDKEREQKAEYKASADREGAGVGLISLQSASAWIHKANTMSHSVFGRTKSQTSN